MNREKKTDFIIIGQGLAGSLLAYRLKKAGKKVVVFDSQDEATSSLVAAGLFNPVTGRRFVRTWKAEELFPLLFDFYQGLAGELKAALFHPVPLFRPFLSIREQNEVIASAEQGHLGSFAGRIVTTKPESVPLNNRYGGIFLTHTGYVDVPLMIETIRKKFLADDFFYEKFEEDLLDLSDGKVRYRNFSAGKIIYCTGFHAAGSKYFSWLPFRPVKGELILIKTLESLPFIFNRQIFVIPYSDGHHKVGATYDWKNTDVKTTPEARAFLEQKLKKFFRIEFSTVDQQAGIRPATRDRRPFIGMHPDIPQLGIFNGLGSKGVSLAPYFSQNFADYLLKGKEIDKNVHINRYNSLDIKFH